jgi:hypothetical protein
VRTAPVGVSYDLLLPLLTLAVAYFVATRVLLYFTLLIRQKLDARERMMILRYEVLAYLLTLIGSAAAAWAVHALPPLGFIAVLTVLGMVGVLTIRILEESIAAEELNKIIARERVLTSTMSLGAALSELEQLANRCSTGAISGSWMAAATTRWCIVGPLGGMIAAIPRSMRRASGSWPSRTPGRSW